LILYWTMESNWTKEYIKIRCSIESYLVIKINFQIYVRSFFSRWVTQALDRGVDRIELCSVFCKLVDFNRESLFNDHLRFWFIISRERETLLYDNEEVLRCYSFQTAKNTTIGLGLYHKN